ncbi:type I-B CRISPR-associated protein Cas7/Cst2/DevR [Nocardia panacis]|uniref:Type I-B CRISPR-associated protein Cas7/Cst2/DevR n=1 Tax=Nocardia panacis TaxID=2340916 RepID=A0A3A4KYW6_9NOCA|nr:type I-B CRISPR-associated protein Cas7/Cst2/DevR [Nocardia panacis]RJO79154.1 type I-B CRISPR-associated protein Cas7/Cst2/DevR [Nocardia panacis]
MTHLVGKIALDIVAGAPNNGRGDNNVGEVKKMRIGRDTHPYVSAQAFRRWLRESLPTDVAVSPVTRSGSKANQQAYTAGRPDLYPDDDLFGYMVAVKGGSYQRDTVLATGTLLSVTPQWPTRDFGTMSRGFGNDENPVIHEHEHYTAQLAADVSLDLPRVGVFQLQGSGPRRNLTDTAAAEAEAAGADKTTFRGMDSVRLPIEERRRRVVVLLNTLAQVRGGAKQALHYGERSPALVLLAPLKGGNNPFTRILTARAVREDQGHPHRETVFDAHVLREEMAAWADQLDDGPVLLGWAPGFLGDQRERVRGELTDLIEAGAIVLDHPRVLLRGLAKQIEAGERDDWFEVPQR